VEKRRLHSFVFFQYLPKVNYHLMGENSPNLVTLNVDVAKIGTDTTDESEVH
jgi:hypothetical protein